MNDHVNILSVDVEEWFVVEALRDRFPQSSWPDLPSTLERNCLILLDLLELHQAHATWFVLGWCADQQPDVIREIAERGHEIACHSYWHRRVDELDAETFRADTLRACEAIEKASGVYPKGYRAPSWSMSRQTAWAFDILADLGFVYDSSIFPIKHDIYGMPAGPREVFRMDSSKGRSLFELPASTYRVLGNNVPVAGGGYLRHQPYWYTRRLINRMNKMGKPAVVYMHPWELDANPPRVHDLSPLQWYRTYGSTQVMTLKIDRLLSDFRFTTIGDFLHEHTRRPIGFH
jgi:polysaccharide deacetylase family protein (PEP-CTERM system associated)